MVLSSLSQAGGQHAAQTHGDGQPLVAAAHGGEMGGHAHKRWVAPPEQYRDLVHSGWQSVESGERGRQLFSQLCAACHGQDGTGNGPKAASLAHPPADLTNHFHRADGQGTGYLFWRVSEGGRVEPFRSRDSAMPAFKGILSEQQRWDVLTYIHQRFHGGFKEQDVMPAHTGDHDKMHRDSGH